MIDDGVGIRWTAFPTTIMSLEGSNKLSNHLMAGSYGFGGAAIYRDSAFSIIWSRSLHEPEIIGFTVVYQRYSKTARFPSYVYLVGDDQNVMTFPAAELPSSITSLPSEITSANVMQVSDKVLIPEHGTGIRVFEIENFSAGPRVYEFLRDRGFGMPVPCRFRNGVENSELSADDRDVDSEPDVDARRGSTKRLYNVIGLRHSLNSRESRKTYPVVFHQAPIAIMEAADGGPQATLECWVLERAAARNEARQPNAAEPVIESVLGRDRRNTPCYITLNGMTQENISTSVMLRNARLPYLRNHLVIEVNCDRMARISRAGSSHPIGSASHVSRKSGSGTR